jgi:hypothetical protein
VHPTELLIRLIRRTLILTIDVKTAEAAGDPFAIGYQRPVRARQREAAEAVAEIRESGPSPRRSRRSRRLRSRY